MNKIAICVLTRGYSNLNDYSNLISRNLSIKEKIDKLNQNNVLEYLIFHEGNINIEHQKYIIKLSSPLNIKFINVSNEFDDYETYSSYKSNYAKKTELSECFPRGYKMMCRFWFSRFFKYVENFNFLVRIDEDCEIVCMDLNNIIESMQEKGVKFISPSAFGLDSPDVTVGLERLTTEFCDLNELVCSNLMQPNPLTCIFIMNLDFFRNNLIFNKYVSAVENSRGIEINRWGDAPLWGIILALTNEKEQGFICKDIKYIHGSFYEFVNFDPTFKQYFMIKFKRLRHIILIIKKKLWKLLF